MHIVGWLLLWALIKWMQTPVIFLVGHIIFNQYPTGIVHLPAAVVGCLALGLYAGLMYYIHHCLPGVSDPGGPRTTLTPGMSSWRYPQWSPDSIHVLDDSFSCRFLSSEDSNRATNITFKGTCAKLSGESIGRDIWGFLPDGKKNLSIEQEKRVNDLASGGRGPGFIPSKNPNT